MERSKFELNWSLVYDRELTSTDFHVFASTVNVKPQSIQTVVSSGIEYIEHNSK